MPKTNIAEFAVEQEATPGTAETLVSADVAVRLRQGYALTPDHEQIDLEEIKTVSSHTAMVIGRRLLTANVAYVLRGPGDLTTAPAINDMWESALFNAAAAKTIAIGAVTGGPYVAGETITGGTSSATGMVLQDTANGAASIPYLPLSGTLVTTETLTGGTSGATSTSSGGPADGGYCYRPADWTSGAGHHCTFQLNRDGYEWTGRGGLSDISWAFRNGGPCVVTQNFTGALSSDTSTAVFGVTSWPEASVTVPKFLNVALKIDGYSPTGINEVSVTWPTNPTIVEDANSSSGQGVLYADYDRTTTAPTISLQVDQVATGTYDFFNTLQGGGTLSFEMTHGSTSGAIWTFAAPKAQIVSIGLGEVDPRRAQFSVEMSLTGDNNDELLIWQH